MAEPHAAQQAAQEANASGLFTFLGVIFTGLLGLVGIKMRQNKRAAQPAHLPGLTIHEMLGQLSSAISDVGKGQEASRIWQARMEERMVTKDGLAEALQGLERFLDGKEETDVKELHTRITRHLAEDHSKAA